jgi:hypothetical protein
LDRLLACHRFIHLIRTIGHHIDRLACRSVSIMVKAIPLEGPGFAGGVIPRASNAQPMRRVPGRLGTGLT